MESQEPRIAQDNKGLVYVLIDAPLRLLFSTEQERGQCRLLQQNYRQGLVHLLLFCFLINLEKND